MITITNWRRTTPLEIEKTHPTMDWRAKFMYFSHIIRDKWGKLQSKSEARLAFFKLKTLLVIETFPCCWRLDTDQQAFEIWIYKVMWISWIQKVSNAQEFQNMKNTSYYGIDNKKWKSEYFGYNKHNYQYRFLPSSKKIWQAKR